MTRMYAIVLTGCVVWACGVGAARADFIVNEDFNGYSDGAALPDWFDNGAATVEAEEGDGTKLGAAGNIVANISDDSGSGGKGREGLSLGDGTVASYAFDLYRDTSAAWLLSLGTFTPNPAQRWAGGINMNLPQDQAVTLSILINRSGGEQSYYNPVSDTDVTLPDDHIAVFWYNADTHAFSEITADLASVNDSISPNRVWFYQGAGGGTLLVDNIRSSSELEVFGVPEPGSLGLLGGGVLCLLARRRRW